MGLNPNSSLERKIMQLILILGISVAIGAVVFALQNIATAA